MDSGGTDSGAGSLRKTRGDLIATTDTPRPRADTGYVAALVDDGYPPRPIPDAVFSSVVHLPFEGRSLSVPSGYKELLGLHYGDWKQIPPEDKRAVHVVEAYRLSR